MRALLEQAENIIFSGQAVGRELIERLAQSRGNDIFSLMDLARRVTERFAEPRIDLCSIVNAKSGACSEDCRYCAQSAWYSTGVEVYDLLNSDTILERAHELEESGAQRFSLVMSGRGIDDRDLERILEIYLQLKEKTGLRLCASLGIMSKEQLEKLKDVGVTMYHHNIETSRAFFPRICSTHSFDERIDTIRAVQEVGMDVCSGGIFSMGETIEDRIDMAFELCRLNIPSVPINVLNPIAGTPLEHQTAEEPMEILKSIALFRLVLPKAYIRIAGGREKALRNLQALCFMAGANAALVGSYLTTGGRTVAEDVEMLRDLGLNV